MPGPIVAATDFSPRADRAIDRALQLGAEWSSQVVLLHAIDGSEGKADRSLLDAQMASVLPESVAGADQVKFVYAEGSTPEALAGAAEELEARLIVMGPARYNSLGDYLLGTAVDHALRHCKPPILVVKRRPHRPYRTILAATDFSAPSGAALRLALEWFPRARVHLVHGCHISFESWQRDPYVKEEIVAGGRKRLDEFLAGLGLEEAQGARVETHLIPGSVHEAVNRVTGETGAELVVIGSHGESGFRHATIGSMANALLETTLVDTLMVTTRG